MTPCLTSRNIELLRKKAKEINPNGVPPKLESSFSDMMKEVRREGAQRTPFGRGFKANHALKELDI